MAIAFVMLGLIFLCVHTQAHKARQYADYTATEDALIATHLEKAHKENERSQRMVRSLSP
jgi:hypothetical protein